MKQKTIVAYDEHDFDDTVNSFRMMPGIVVRFATPSVCIYPNPKQNGYNEIMYTCVMLYDEIGK